MRTVSSMFFLVTAGSMPRRPSLAPVSRITMSGLSFITQLMRDSVPLLVSPLMPALTTFQSYPASRSFFSSCAG